MFKLSTLETGLGAIALAAVTSGAYLVAGGAPQQLMTFLGVTSVALLAASGLLVTRVQQYELEVRQQLLGLLPNERKGSLLIDDFERLDKDDLVDEIGDHLKQQQELLNANYLNLIHGNQLNPELEKAEDELCRLRAELASLEDQFRSEQLMSSVLVSESFDMRRLLNGLDDNHQGSASGNS